MKHNNSFNEAFKRGMDALVNDDFSESVEEFTKAIEIDPYFALTYVSRKAALMKMHRIEKSILDFNRAIELNPEYPKTYHLRGLARVEVEDHEGAMEDFGNVNRRLEEMNIETETAELQRIPRTLVELDDSSFLQVMKFIEEIFIDLQIEFEKNWHDRVYFRILKDNKQITFEQVDGTNE